MHSVVVFETTNDIGEPYYPVPNEKNKKLYERYKELADKEENVYFLGRLANYKYFNMDEAIKNSLDFFKNNLSYNK
jgi:UDP-galactopyranose mutase